MITYWLIGAYKTKMNGYCPNSDNTRSFADKGKAAQKQLVGQ